MRLAVALVLTIASHAVAQQIAHSQNAPFANRCKAASAVLCLALDSEAEITDLRFAPAHLDASNRVQWDAEAKAARFTIPSNSPADSSGQLHIPFPRSMVDVYFSFDVRYPDDFLRYRFKGGDGWKIFILGQGKQGCSPYELVANNPYYRSLPGFYYICGSASRAVAVQNPWGDNLSQFDYQPGGETECLRNPRVGSKPCAFFEPDTWITYQVHINTVTATLEAWQTVRGKTLKIIEYQLQGFPLPAPEYEWLKLTPYNTGKDAKATHPQFSLWYRRVIVAAKKIPFPDAQ